MREEYNTFKAGDFTKGQMGDIFRACFMGSMAYINHKQFGTAYMVPEDVIASFVVVSAANRDDYQKYILDNEIKTHGDEMLLHVENNDDLLEIMNDMLNFEHVDLLHVLLNLAGGYKNIEVRDK